MSGTLKLCGFFYFICLLVACGGDATSVDSDIPSPTSNSGENNVQDEAPPVGQGGGNSPPTISESALRGKELYESSIQGCLGCHGPDGQLATFRAIDLGADEYTHSTRSGEAYTLEQYLEIFMPVQDTLLCTADCAEDIASYIRYLAALPPEPTPPAPTPPAPGPTPPAPGPTPPVPGPTPPAPELIGLSFFHAVDDILVGELVDGVTINVNGIAENQRTVVATVTDAIVESVTFELRDTADNLVSSRTENSPPYALFGDVATTNPDGYDLHGGTAIPNGSYTLQVSAYSQNRGQGTLVARTTRTFVLASLPTPTPTPTPTPINPSLTFTPSDTAVSQGGSIRLRWSTTDMQRCESSSTPNNARWANGRDRNLNNSNGVLVSDLQVTTEFSMDCTASNGATIRRSVEVAVTPVGDADNGRTLFNTPLAGASLSCAGCHSADGANPAIAPRPINQAPCFGDRCVDEETLAAYITQFMPLPPGGCNAQCGRDIAAYLVRDIINPAPVVAPPTGSASIGYGQRNLRLLTRTEYESSVRDLTGYQVDSASAGMPIDRLVEGLPNQVLTPVNLPHADAFRSMAQEISRNITPGDIVACGNINRGQCASRFISDFAKKAFRRPLTTEEADRYRPLFQASHAANKNAGIRLAVNAIFNSPNFLYRSEMGEPVPADVSARPDPDIADDAFVLTPYEMATFLAYTYTGTTPDQPLMDAADNDRLNTDAEINGQVSRLMGLPKARDHFGNFFAANWLRTDRVREAQKDDALYPGFTASVRASMAAEVRELFEFVMFNGERPVRQLYGNSTFLNQELADFYGISGTFENNRFTRVTNLPNRGGILTSGAFMAGFSHQDESSPIQRAVFVREHLLCQEVPPMPDNLDGLREESEDELQQLIRDSGGAVSNRVIYHQLTKDSPCDVCHAEIINPLGFGMENFDAVGLLRTSDLNGISIDDSGELIGVAEISDGDRIPYIGGRALSSELQDLPGIADCFRQKALRFVLGTGHAAFDGDERDTRPLTDDQRQAYSRVLDDMQVEMEANNNNIRAAFRALGTADVVRYRR